MKNMGYYFFLFLFLLNSKIFSNDNWRVIEAAILRYKIQHDNLCQQLRIHSDAWSDLDSTLETFPVERDIPKPTIETQFGPRVPISESEVLQAVRDHSIEMYAYTMDKIRETNLRISFYQARLAHLQRVNSDQKDN